MIKWIIRRFFNFGSQHVEDEEEDIGPPLHNVPGLSFDGVHYMPFEIFEAYVRSENLMIDANWHNVLGVISKMANIYEEAELTPFIVWNTNTGQLVCTSEQCLMGQFKQ